MAFDERNVERYIKFSTQQPFGRSGALKRDLPINKQMVYDKYILGLSAGMNLPVSVLSSIDPSIPGQQNTRFDELQDVHHDTQYWRSNFSS
uniref:Uncharacterized protein n=1 Tax=Syphacia muris TaxID=451379 RepID=A0A0N5B135_9BILA